ncbi:hypothetical protein [Nocardia sp. NPDC050793]|uniref:hypothetical protein n=1 Tax=Nocardia sp. NPDC050793 TaxID=3155159 RepID=UPI0033F32EB7
MTTAERLRAEGRAEGRVETLIEQLTVKFGSLPAEIIETVHAGNSTQLRTWTSRILTADTLKDVLA